MSIKSKESSMNDILGKNIQILSSSNKYNNNKTGKIVNETKNMIYLLSDKNTLEIKKYLKKRLTYIKLFYLMGITL